MVRYIYLRIRMYSAHFPENNIGNYDSMKIKYTVDYDDNEQGLQRILFYSKFLGHDLEYITGTS